ncbi:sodium potassium-transporting ATPase subunit alpha, putative, partial [Bodo saltans]
MASNGNEPIELASGSNEPSATYHSHEPVRRNTSRLRRMQDRPSEETATEPRRTPSLLQRLKAAPIDIVASRAAYEEGELPPRSPTGTMRQHSGLTRRKISAAKVREAEAVETTDNWHKLTNEQIFTHFKSRDNGFTDEEAAEQLKVVGPNKITEPPRQSLLVKFFLNCLGGFSLMLLGASILAFVIFAIEKSQQQLFDVQTLALAIVLIIVILITSGFQTYQEGQADNVMASLMEMAAEDTFVVRGGKTFKIPSNDLVPGDIVKVGVGEKVPADLRILEASELKVNNAPLTGENVDIKLGTEPRNDTLFEAKNIARSGCTFTSGSGVAIVFATGDNTFLGKIAEATTSAETPDTLLKREVRRIIVFMSGIAVVLSAIVLGLSFGRGDKWYIAIVYVIGIVIANVPEGLLPQITVALTLTAQRMLERGVLVTNMEIIETLGAVT